MQIASKSQMYALLTAGKLGNTLQQYANWYEWCLRDRPPHWPTELWGIRSYTPGGPGAMFCLPFQVDAFTAIHGSNFNISPMIHDVTLMANIYEDYVNYVEFPPARGVWRELMLNAKHVEGVAANHLLRRHLNDNAYDDVQELRLLYPGHVIEISVTSRCIGLLPHRNYVTWEVRCY